MKQLVPESDFNLTVTAYDRLCRPSPVFRTKVYAAIALMLLSCGCVSGRFTQAAGQFGTLTKIAADQQNERLAAVEADELERYRQNLVTQKYDLQLQDCAAIIAGAPPAALKAQAGGNLTCHIAVKKAPGVYEALPATTNFGHISALNHALVKYADGLEKLASDATSDQQTFTGSVTALATSVGNLQGAITKATGKESDVTGGKIDAVGNLVAKAGNLYFAARRQAVLKRIIVESAPLVQRATDILGDTGTSLDVYGRVPLYMALIDAQTAWDAAYFKGDPKAIRSAQDALFEAVNQYNAYQSERMRFTAIGIAHAKLVKAANAGASASELQAAIVSLLDLAKTISETENAFSKEK
ncbi:hypothetical protein [Novosphingobium beihaiensis]|uniref:Uncharacterized protein n=1 Tax=Novosphingobium beihaiensis TaxID=2930389 RepID=A0ABT0BVS5_9SPHN|nr:hypothetical protein [Novosphingobium beihaiensis]MCJ2189171.1 hypothetical protein [Novosphingobium beihaiensis]